MKLMARPRDHTLLEEFFLPFGASSVWAHDYAILNIKILPNPT